MRVAVERCAGTFTTGLLTNNFVSWSDAAGEDAPDPDLAEVLSCFDAVVESSVVGVRKPEPKFYELALEQLGVAAADSVFLDDLGVNLKPARTLGMHTIKVDDPDLALMQLQALVGFPLAG